MTTPNFQLPTPKENRSNSGVKKAATGWFARVSAGSVERLSLRVGSWALGVVEIF
jgi:hypothetical protein